MKTGHVQDVLDWMRKTDLVEIRYKDYLIHADKVNYNEDTGEARAEGHVTHAGSLRSGERQRNLRL